MSAGDPHWVIRDVPCVNRDVHHVTLSEAIVHGQDQPAKPGERGKERVGTTNHMRFSVV